MTTDSPRSSPLIVLISCSFSSKVKDVDVLCDPAGIRRPRDGHQTELDVPSEHDLRRGLAVIFRYPVITGSFLSSSLDAPSGLYDSVTMPCAAW